MLVLLMSCLGVLVAVPLKHAMAARDVGARPAFSSAPAVAPLPVTATSSPPPSSTAAPVQKQKARTPAQRTKRPAARVTRPLPPAPTVLEVPRLGIRTAVQAVGVSPDGSLALPPARRVGWYRSGASPGGVQGSAVLAGHVDSRTEGRGALFPLQSARPGDRVLVGLADGRALRYEVVARERLPRGRLPVRELFARTGAPRLTLITCGGEYNPARGGYEDNVVVTAVPSP